MCKLFDEQLKGIYSILDNQLDYLKKERSSKQVVSYPIVLFFAETSSG